MQQQNKFNGVIIVNSEIEKSIDKFKESFPLAFVYQGEELIIDTKNNVYFRIDDIETAFDFQCKVISWLSRPAHKSHSKWWRGRLTNGINKFLGTNFKQSDFKRIYTFVGCGSNMDILKAFVDSGFDLDVLPHKLTGDVS